MGREASGHSWFHRRRVDQLLSWVVFPLAAAAICFGTGALAARLARVALEPALLAAVGYAAAIAILGIVFATGVGAVPALIVLIALAVAGLVTARPLPRPRLGAAAGVATYLLHIAPVALTGTATFLGYDLLNDTAIHLSIVDWIGQHGSHWSHQPPGSYGAAINDYVGTRYPLGSHELLAALRPLVGRDPALLYQPFLAVSAGIAAAAIYALLRSALGDGRAAVAAFAAMASQIVFSFALQGSIKELGFIVCLTAAAGAGAALRRGPDGAAALVALPAVALYGIYGVYALPWIAPIALLAWLLARPRVRALGIGVVVFAAGVAVLVPGSIHYYDHGHDVITSGQELGPLAGPLKFVQVAGVWLGGDYRFVPSHSWATYLLCLLVLIAAVAGLVRAGMRRNAAVLLFTVPALVAYLVTSPSSSPYIDAKLLAILSPAVVAAAMFALGTVRRRGLAIGLSAALVLLLLASDTLAYRLALPAPMARLDELSRIDARYSGRGPMLVNEFEEYVKHFMRRSPGSDPYESWTAARAQLRDPGLPVAGHEYDLDQMRTAFIERWRYIVLRRSPYESDPPANYKRVWNGRWYDVWERVGPAPLAHIPLGSTSASAPLACKRARFLENVGDVVAKIRPQPEAVPLSGQLPPGWYRYGPDPSMLDIHKGGSLRLPDTSPPSGLGPDRRVEVWLRGRTTRKDQLVVNGVTLAVPRTPQRVGEWIDVGSVPASATMTLELRRPTRSLRPGDAQPDIVGPVALVARRPAVVVRGRAIRAACGAPADWLDVLAR
jgi:hypothetical protein